MEDLVELGDLGVKLLELLVDRNDGGYGGGGMHVSSPSPPISVFSVLRRLAARARALARMVAGEVAVANLDVNVRVVQCKQKNFN